MLPLFCLRLGLGMTACLFLLDPGRAFAARPVVGPRFFRTQFLTVLGLALLAWLFLPPASPWPDLLATGAAAALAFAGSLTYALEGGPGGRSLIVLTTAALGAGLGLQEWHGPGGGLPALLAGLSSAAVLGSALSAMLLGHSYLIAPSMSIAPLFRLLAAVLLSLVVRMAVEGCALAGWTGPAPSYNQTGDLALWLPVRWGVGFAAPLVLCWMAWQTARIRSTQSATGILYVVVVFCLLGELFSAVAQPWSR